MRHILKELYYRQGAHGLSIASLFRPGDVGGFWDARSYPDNLIDQLVDSWSDRVFGNIVSQSVDARKPTLRASGNKRWLEFDIDDTDGEDVLGDILIGELAFDTAQCTVIIACHNQDETGETGSNGNRRVWILKREGENDDGELQINFNANPYEEPDPDVNGGVGMRNPSNVAVLLPVEGNNALTTPGVVAYQRDGTSIQDAWVDDVEFPRVTETAETFQATHMAIGGSTDGSLTLSTTGAGHWIGPIAAVLAIDRVLSPLERVFAMNFIRQLLPPEPPIEGDQSIFSPDFTTFSNFSTAHATLGTVFDSDVDGYVTGVAVYDVSGLAAVRIELWDFSTKTTGTLLASVADAGAHSGSGWETFEFDEPIAITQDTPYIICYRSLGNWYGSVGHSDTEHVTGNLRQLANGDDTYFEDIGVGRYTFDAAGEFPATINEGTLFGVDVIFNIELPEE